MANDVKTAPAGKDLFPAARTNDPSLSGLVGGIFDDTLKLIEQQFTLLKVDFRKDLDRAKDTGMMIGFGIAMLTAGGLVLLFMLAHLLEWLTRPNLELWACYAIVGGAVALVGGIVFFRGKKKLDNLDIVPEETAQGIKENLQWKTNPN